MTKYPTAFAQKQIKITWLQKIDENGDGAISFDEWLAFVINKYKGENPDHNVN